MAEFLRIEIKLRQARRRNHFVAKLDHPSLRTLPAVPAEIQDTLDGIYEYLVALARILADKDGRADTTVHVSINRPDLQALITLSDPSP